MYLNQIKSALWYTECDMSTPYRAMTVQIGFSHKETKFDETEFSIEAWNVQELAKLFDVFCNENKFKDVHVFGLYIVRVAETMDELVAMEEHL